MHTQHDPPCASVPHFSSRVFILSTVLILPCASFSHSTSLIPNCNLRKIISKCSVPFLSSYPLFYGWQMSEREGLVRKRPCLGWRHVIAQCDGTKGSRQHSVAVVDGHHATACNARRLVQRLVTRFKLAHHSPSCCVTDRQTAVLHVSLKFTVNCLSFKNFVLHFPDNPWQVCNTIFTYTQLPSALCLLIPHHCHTPASKDAVNHSFALPVIPSTFNFRIKI